MSTYSDNLRIELIGTGTQAGTWGNTTNDNLATVLEAAIAGKAAVNIGSSTQALTYLNGPTTTASANQSVRAILVLTTSTSANFAVYAPPVSKQYVVYNNSSYTATLYNSTVIGNTTAAGTGIAVPAGAKMALWSDGTNFYQQTTHLISPTISGNATAVTQSIGDNSTKLATTAYVDGSLGTIASQDADAVNITGGSITGITDLAVADGGTGSSSLTANAVLLGNGTSAIQTVAPGTSGNVLTSNGTTWASSTPTPGVPSGAVMSFAMSTAPSGWIECNGSAVSRTTYADLFAAIGTTYGSGDGSTTFNLPDLRGEFVRGWDHGRGVDSGRALGSAQTGTSVLVSGGSPYPVSVSQNTENNFAISSDALGGVSYHYGLTYYQGYVRPRNIALMYCIKT